MIPRCPPTALLEAEPLFRGVRGYRDLPYLVTAPGRAGPTPRSGC